MEQAIERIGDGVTREWVNGVAIYTLTSANRGDVDAYIDSSLQLLREWPREQRVLTVHDISSPDVSLTPYMRSRLNNVSEYIAASDLEVKSAVVLNNNFMGQVMRTFGRMFTSNAPNLEQLFFVEMHTALNWIQQQRR